MSNHQVEAQQQLVSDNNILPQKKIDSTPKLRPTGGCCGEGEVCETLQKGSNMPCQKKGFDSWISNGKAKFTSADKRVVNSTSVR